MEKDIKKPDKFKIKVENKNGKAIIDFLVEKGYDNDSMLSGDCSSSESYYGYNGDIFNYIRMLNSSLINCKEYTLDVSDIVEKK